MTAAPAHTHLTITATRNKNGKWRLHIVYPDGSYATHRGVVDYGYAGAIAERALWKAEEMLVAAPARDHRCPSCGAEDGDSWFDRSLCPCGDGSGVMHQRCVHCGYADDCPFDQQPAAVPVSEGTDRD